VLFGIASSYKMALSCLVFLEKPDSVLWILLQEREHIYLNLNKEKKSLEVVVVEAIEGTRHGVGCQA
jgi:hypothetical protein